MTTFRVTWDIDVELETDNPEEAARQAHEIVRRPDTTANVYTVENRDTGAVTSVDLQELAPAPKTDVRAGRQPVDPLVFKHYLDDFTAFVAGKAPDLHWSVSGAAGAEGLYEGGFDGYRHGFGMTALKPRPLPDLMAEMKNALLRALATTEGQP